MQPATNTAANSTNSITASIRNFFQNLTGTPGSGQAEGDIAQYNKLRPKTADILSAFDEQYGVNDQMKRVSDLRRSVMGAEDLISALPENVRARTSGDLVSQASLDRLTAAEKDPLVRQLGTISRNFDVANQDLSGMREQSNRYSTAEIGDIDRMGSSLSERLSNARAREEAERIRQQQEEENRRWWEDYYLRKAQSDAQIENLRAQTAATRSKASQSNIDLSALMKQLGQSGVDWNKINSAVGSPSKINQAAAAGSVIGSQPSSNNFWNDMWGNAAKYGPLALVGGGWAWK